MQLFVSVNEDLDRVAQKAFFSGSWITNNNLIYFRTRPLAEPQLTARKKLNGTVERVSSEQLNGNGTGVG